MRRSDVSSEDCASNTDPVHLALAPRPTSAVGLCTNTDLAGVTRGQFSSVTLRVHNIKQVPWDEDALEELVVHLLAERGTG